MFYLLFLEVYMYASKTYMQLMTRINVLFHLNVK